MSVRVTEICAIFKFAHLELRTAIRKKPRISPIIAPGIDMKQRPAPTQTNIIMICIKQPTNNSLLLFNSGKAAKIFPLGLKIYTNRKKRIGVCQVFCVSKILGIGGLMFRVLNPPANRIVGSVK